MIQQIKSRTCKQVYIEDLNLRKMSYSEINNVVLVDTSPKARVENSCKLLFLDTYYTGYRMYSAYTGRYIKVVNPKRYLVVDYNIISDIQDELLGRKSNIKHVRWATLLPVKYLKALCEPNKDLHDF